MTAEQPILVTQDQLNQAVESSTLAVSKKLATRTIVRAAIVAAVVAALISSGISITVTLVVGHEIARNNSERITETQHSRKFATIISCEQQNLRHEQLYVQIEAQVRREAIKEPVKYRETVAKARELEALLNAIQPEEDCDARAKLLVQETLHAKPKPRVVLRAPGPLRLPRPAH